MHVVITGASSGIGEAIAEAFDQPGNRLSLVARRLPLLEALSERLSAESQPIQADLADADAPTAWLERAEASFGPTDVLINNAGISYVEPATGIEAERVRKLFQVNVHTPIAAIHHVLPAMLDRDQGAVVNIASNAAFSPAPYFTHYTATKGALANFSESLRMELRHTNVHVMTVYPGPIDTPMADRNWAQIKPSLSARLTPTGDAKTMAALTLRGVKRRKARVIYPRAYALTWWLPGIGRWVAERAFPGVTGEKTPPLPGDLVDTSQAPAAAPSDSKKTHA